MPTNKQMYNENVVYLDKGIFLAVEKKHKISIQMYKIRKKSSQVSYPKPPKKYIFLCNI